MMYLIHPAAEIPPPLAEDDYKALLDSIAQHGQQHPIILFEGRVIDGRHRYQACCELGIVPRVEHYAGNLTPLEIVKLNLARRHLDASQKAVVALDIQAYEAVLAKERQRGSGGDRKSDVYKKSVPANLPEPIDKTANPKRKQKESRERAAAATGASARNVQKAKKIATEAPDLLEKVRAGAMTLNAAENQLKERKREDRRAENREKVAAVPAAQLVVAARFATIVIDPPWDWGDEGDQDQLGRARPEYNTIPIHELRALPVSDLADVDCHIYMWITNRSLPKGFDLLSAWGFRYVTCLTWVKPHFGMGNYFRGQTEQVLFGVRGSQPLKRKDAGTVFHAPRGPNGHSSKPVELYDLVESCSPGPYLEMFSRADRIDWTHWGENARTP